MLKTQDETRLTGSTPTMMQSGLCFFFIARETPVTVPPVPAPATKVSTKPLDGLFGEDGVLTMASIISGPVEYSCANGLFS